ncbi:hypothetical protein ACA910_020733 [Epithemia clementina (nom. ined.)]
MSVIGEEQALSKQEEDLLFGDEQRPPSPAAQRTKDRFGNILGDQQHTPNPLDYAADPLVNKLRTSREIVQSCPEVWSELARHCPDRPAILDEHLCDERVELNFQQMDDTVSRSAAIFAGLGVRKGTHVAVLGENSAYWLIVDHGIQRAGGVSAVRGADAPPDELRYIYEHSDSAGIVVMQGPKLVKKMAESAKAQRLQGLGLANPTHDNVRTVILMHREKASDDDIAKMSADLGVKILFLGDLLKTTEPLKPEQYANLNRNDVATIVYTSGTTGRPKGVMLRHGNLLHQTGLRLSKTKPYEQSEPLPGETMVSILPVWHITERTFELWVITRGCRVVYSGIRWFKNDLAKHKPEWLVLVPRILEKIASGVQDKFNGGSAAVKVLAKAFTNVGQATNRYRKLSRGLVVGSEPPGPLETISAKALSAGVGCLNAVGNKLIWSKVQEGFGGNLKTIICGGSALVGSLEKFYETAGIQICVGYGLTECSPLLSYRRSDENLVVAGCVGKPCYDSEIRVVDTDLIKVGGPTPPALPPGEVGTVLGRGPQVMLGYYKNEKATAEAIDPAGWFNTGDLGRINPATGDLILTGRAKDTIVLSNGENIEPTPIEDAILGESNLVDQVMLTGQDGRRLVAITVLNPKALAEDGFVSDPKTVKELQEAVDKVNDPKIRPDECEGELKLLQSFSAQLRQDSGLKSRLVDDMARATTNFRKWEQVGSVYYTLEPFAMANGLLTQSYKVKRNVVLDRYKDSLLPK